MIQPVCQYNMTLLTSITAPSVVTPSLQSEALSTDTPILASTDTPVLASTSDSMSNEILPQLNCSEQLQSISAKPLSPILPSVSVSQLQSTDDMTQLSPLLQSVFPLSEDPTPDLLTTQQSLPPDYQHSTTSQPDVDPTELEKELFGENTASQLSTQEWQPKSNNIPILD